MDSSRIKDYCNSDDRLGLNVDTSCLTKIIPALAAAVVTIVTISAMFCLFVYLKS